MPTNKEADKIYEEALEGLNKVIRAGRATTEEQREIAKEKRTDLTLNYINQSITNIEERTAKFQAFIGEMYCGTLVDIIGGPEYNQGYTWWQVRVPALNNMEGWSIEDNTSSKSEATTTRSEDEESMWI